MASSDAAAAAAALTDTRLRASLAAAPLPFTTSDVGAMPPQEGLPNPTIPTTDVSAVPPQEGPPHRAVRAGMSLSVARASILALHRFYDPSKLASARVLPARELSQALARALVDYGATTRTTWVLENDNNISTSEAEFFEGTTPGQVATTSSEFWYSNEATSDAAAICAALKIPPTAKVWIGSDSSLKLYAVDAAGKATGGKANDSIGLWKNKCWNYSITADIVSGATLGDIIGKQLPTEAVDSYDVSMVFCTLNAVEGVAVSAFSEASALGQELLFLCQRLRQHRRPVVILGGTAALWGFDPRWDQMVQKAILICRHQGVQAIDGARCFVDMQRMPTGWHSAKTPENHEIYIRMFEDARSVAYAVTPHGSFANLVAAPESEVLPAHLQQRQAPPQVTPPQEGSQLAVVKGS